MQPPKLPRFFRFCLLHPTLATLLYVVPICLAYAIALTTFGVGVGWIVGVCLFVLFVGWAFVSGAYVRLMQPSAKFLLSTCDPAPLLEAATFAAAHTKGVAQQVSQLNLADALADSGKEEQALAILRGINIDQYNILLIYKVVYYYDLASLLEEIGGSEEEVRLCREKVSALFPLLKSKLKEAFHNVDVTNRAQILAARGEYETAWQTLATRRDENLHARVSHTYLRAELLSKMGQTEKAKEELRLVIRHGNRSHLVTRARALLATIETTAPETSLE
jgi:predicted negative regulator of RcsB-dependent stress response